MSTTTEILQRVETLNVSSEALTAEPMRPRIMALIDAGLLKSSRVLRAAWLALRRGVVASH